MTDKEKLAYLILMGWLQISSTHVGLAETPGFKPCIPIDRAYNLSMYGINSYLDLIRSKLNEKELLNF